MDADGTVDLVSVDETSTDVAAHLGELLE